MFGGLFPLAACLLAQDLKVDAPLVESLKLGGRIRLRGEWRDPADYRIPGTNGRPATDDPRDGTDFILERARLYADAQVIPQIRAYVEIQDARRFGEETALNVDTADLDLKQGFLEFPKLFDKPLTLTVGRIEVPALGDQRLVTSLDWDNVGRSLDGGILVYAPEGWRVTLAASNLREAATLTPTGDEGDDFVLGILYLSFRKIADHEIDVYLILRDLSTETFPSETSAALGERRDGTAGFRFKGKLDRLDYSGEVMIQFGDQADDDVRSWAAAATLGITLEFGWKVRIGGEIAFASGDKSPADGDVETFDPILPFGHFYHGHIDLVGFRNLRSAMVSIRAHPGESWTLHVDAHGFRLARERDGWYAANGSLVRRDPTGSAGRDLGAEIDVYAKCKLWDRLEFWAGYSRFFAGRFIRRTGFSPDADWLFLQAEVKY